MCCICVCVCMCVCVCVCVNIVTIHFALVRCNNIFTLQLLFTTGVKRDASLLEGPSPENSFGFKMSESVLGTSDTSEVRVCSSP